MLKTSLNGWSCTINVMQRTTSPRPWIYFCFLLGLEERLTPSIPPCSLVPARHVDSVCFLICKVLRHTAAPPGSPADAIGLETPGVRCCETPFRRRNCNADVSAAQGGMLESLRLSMRLRGTSLIKDAANLPL